MPDFTTEYHWFCGSNEYYQTHIQGTKENHLVKFEFTHNGLVEYDWKCDCQAFKFSKDHNCKHIEEAKKEYCGWNTFTDGGLPVEEDGEYLCPKCGLRCFSQGIAV